MKMIMAFRWMRTPTTPMMKSAAVSASDSASTGCPPSSQNYRSRNGYEEQHTRQLEGKQIVLEQRFGDRSYGVELLKLLRVEVTGHDELFGKLGARDHHDLAQKSHPNQSRRQLPSRPPSIGER